MDGPVQLMTASLELKKARTVNQTSNGFVSKIVQATEPADDAGTATGQASMACYGNKYNPESLNSLFIQPYGVGADNATFNLRVIGWSRTGRNDEAMVWVPTILAQFACTLCTSVGLANKELVATERLVDTITLTYGNLASIEIVSPGAGTELPGSILMDFKGCQRVELTFDTGGSATSCNALVRQM